MKHAVVRAVNASEGQDEVQESADPSVPAEPSPDALEPAVGSSIDGRYRVDGVLGRGGMSVVYAGEHLELQRAVAIKVLDRAQATDPLVVEHFLLEARTASALSHPHIVSVSDLGRLADGRPFLVMPMIIGTDVADLLVSQGPIAPRRVAVLLRGVAAALDFIHSRGLLHRDIKCENLMHVLNEDGTESLLVLDFGIASASLSRIRQEPGTWSGTPEFMAPESFGGASPDRRADVYSLATVAFELIAGALPFYCEDLDALIAAKTHSTARTLLEASGVEFDPQIEAVIARGLAASPKDRYSSAGALVDALAAACTAAPIQAWRRATTTQRSRRGRTLARIGAGQTLAYADDIHSMDTQPIQIMREGPARPPAIQTPGREPLESQTRPIATRPKQADDPWLDKWSLPEMKPSEPPPSSKPPDARENVTRTSSAPPRVSSKPPATRISSKPPAAPFDVRRWVDYTALTVVIGISVALYTHWTTVQEWVLRHLEPAVHNGTGAQPPAAALEAPEPFTLPLPNLPAGSTDDSSDPSDSRSSVRAARLTRDGQRALGAGDLGSALDAFERARAIDPRYAPAWHGKGLVLDRMGDAREAANAYREFLKLKNSGDDAEKVRKRLWQLAP